MFWLDGNWSHIKDLVVQAFLTLKEAGGLELMRTGGPYSRNLIVIDSKFFTSVAKLKEYVDQAKVYVLPLQIDIPVSDEEDAEMDETVCATKFINNGAVMHLALYIGG